MSEHPPGSLIATLEALGLSSAAEVRRVRGRVRRLSRDLPAFDQVWLDALVQARHLTPLQAEVLSEGDPATLAIGDYLLCQRLGASDVGETFRARHRRKSRRQVAIKLLAVGSEDLDDVASKIGQHVEKLRDVTCAGAAFPFEWRTSGQAKLALIEPFVAGPSPVDLLIHRGRIRPDAVVEIARQLLATIDELGALGWVHGDLRPGSLRLTRRGRVVVTGWGLRGLVPNRELLPQRNLPPDRFDYQAPERYHPGSAIEVSGDLYALGCVLYHLLAGRPPFAGDALAKVMAHQSRRVPDVRELVPDTPPALAETLQTLTEPDPLDRAAEGIGQLGEGLGRVSRGGRRALARYIGGNDWHIVGRRPKPPPSRTRTVLAAGFCALALAVLVVSVVGKQRARAWSSQAMVSTKAFFRDATRPTSSPPSATTVSIPGPREVSTNPLNASGETDEPTVHKPPQSRKADPPSIGELPGRRVLSVRSEPLAISRQGGLLEDLDIRLQSSVTSEGNNHSDLPALVTVTASGVRFRGCRFFGTGPRTGQPPATAVDWKTSEAGPQSLVFENCIFDGVSACRFFAVEGRRDVRFENCLMLGSGPWVVFSRFPAEGNEAAVTVDSSTLRGSGTAFRIAETEDGASPGTIRILANDSVFATPAGLFQFDAPPTPGLLGHMSWEGMGSLIPSETPIGVHITSEGQVTQANCDELMIEGIVHANLEFRVPQPDASRPRGSEIRDVAGAPSLSGKAAGIDAERLPGE